LNKNVRNDFELYKYQLALAVVSHKRGLEDEAIRDLDKAVEIAKRLRKELNKT